MNMQESLEQLWKACNLNGAVQCEKADSASYVATVSGLRHDGSRYQIDVHEI